MTVTHRPARPALFVLAALLALGTGLPGPAAAADPATAPAAATEPSAMAPSATTPSAAQAAPGRRFTPADKGLSHDVFAFFLPSNLDHLLRRADWSVLGTVAYFGIVARPSGRLARTTRGRPDPRWAAWNSAAMDRIISRAHATQTNVVLTVTRFAWTSEGVDATRRLLASSTARRRLAREIAAEVRRRGIDGVNLDFEPIPRSERQRFVDLVRAVRTALDGVRPGLDLTVSATGYIANYDVAGIVAPGGADAILIMAYHYNGSWSARAGSIAPLHRRTYDVADTVDAYLALAPASRIILGVPYYGYVWSTLTGRPHSLTRPSSARWGYPSSVTYRTARGIAAEHGRRWDAVEQGPWVRWQARACATCPLTWRQLYYEDPSSLALKYDLVRSRSLRGTGLWTLGYEGADPAPSAALRAAFLTD